MLEKISKEQQLDKLELLELQGRALYLYKKQKLQDDININIFHRKEKRYCCIYFCLFYIYPACFVCYRFAQLSSRDSTGAATAPATTAEAAAAATWNTRPKTNAKRYF